MADPKDIEIKLKAIGGDAAAGEIRKVEEATEDLAASTDDVSKSSDVLDTAQSDLKDRFAETRRKLEDLRKTTVATAEASGPSAGGLAGRVGGLGKSLLALAGGPIGLAIAALTGLATWLMKLRADAERLAEKTDDLRESTARLRGEIHEFQNPVEDASTAIRAHGDAMDLLVEKSEVANDQLDRRRQELDKTRAAEDAYRLALIDRQVAEGKLSEAEAASQKGEIEKDSLDSQNAAAIEAAQAKIAATEAALQAAGAEAMAAKEALRIAKGQSPETESARLAEEAGRAASAARLKAEEAERTKGASIGDALTRGGATGIAGAAIDYGLQQKAQNDLIEKLNAEAAAREADAAKFIEQATEERSVREKLIAAKQAEADAALAAMETIREQQRQATAELREADLDAKLAENFTKPTIDLGTASSVEAAEKKVRDAEAAAAKKAEAEAAKAAAAQAQAAADAEARAISGDLGRMAGNASASGQVDKGVIDKLNSAAGKLADGTNANEVGGALASLANAVEGLDARQRASLDPVLRRIANLEAQLKNGR